MKKFSMNVYVINVILTFFWGLLFLRTSRGLGTGSAGKKSFCILATIQWILISGLRGLSVGADTYSYYNRFEKTKLTPWNQLFNNFELVYVEDEGKDPGYSVFEKIVQLFTDDYQVFLIIVAVIFFGAMGVWIYKNSENVFLSFIIFDAFMSSFFAVTGLRQTVATVLVVFVGSHFIKKRSFWAFLFVTIIAFTIHKSSICVLPFYFIANIDITRKYIALVLGSLPVLFVFRNQYFKFLGVVVGYEQYSAFDNRGAYGFSLMYIAVVIVSVLLLGYMKERCPDYKLYYNALFMGALFLPLVFVNPSAMRVVQYFSLYLMFLVPCLVKCFERNSQGIVTSGIIGALMLTTNLYKYYYVFFWQE